MEATSAPPILLPGIDHLPCLQEIRSVKDKPFYCNFATLPAGSFREDTALATPTRTKRFVYVYASMRGGVSILAIAPPSPQRSCTHASSVALLAQASQVATWRCGLQPYVFCTATLSGLGPPAMAACCVWHRARCLLPGDIHLVAGVTETTSARLR